MKVVRNVFVVIAIFITLIIGFLSLYIVNYPVSYDVTQEKYLGVVFGAGITINSKPSAALTMRLNKAVYLYRFQKIKKIMVSGTFEEVYVMKSYLTDNDVVQSDILTDTNGDTTAATVENVKNFMQENYIQTGVIFISQKYHIPRISLLAFKKKIPNPTFLSAERKTVSDEENFLFILRESFGFIKSLLFDFLRVGVLEN